MLTDIDVISVFNQVFKLLVEKVSYSLYDDHLRIVNELFKLMANFISDDCVILLLGCIIDRGIVNDNKAFGVLRGDF